LKEFSRKINRRLPDLLPALSKVEDPRLRKDYSMEEILMGGIGMFLFKQGSRNSFNNKRISDAFSANYQDGFGLRLPHQDTVFDVLEVLDPDKLEKLKMDLMASQFKQKWLRKYRLLEKYYMVAVDATGVVSFDYPHCDHCLTKTSKSGKVTWFHYVLEAKLVTSEGHCLSLASEWIENPEGDFVKQDCEQKAFVRLAAKLKKQYPRLPMCILADGLYSNNTVFDICQVNDWKYLIVLQDKSLKSIQQDLILSKRRIPAVKSYEVKQGMRISSKYRFESDIPYQKHNLHWLQCVETRKKDVKPGEKSDKKEEEITFEYITNIPLSKDNVKALAGGGRLRWKIENEGFNTQKQGGYELKHKYCRKSYFGMKNCYTLLQIAHLINQLVEKGKVVVAILREHSKQTIKNIWSNLISYMLMITPCGSRFRPPP